MSLYLSEKYIFISKNVSKIKQKIYIEKELNLEKCLKLIRDFVIEEMPEILEKHRRLMEQLNEYVLGAADAQIRNKTEDEINSIIQKCDDEISRLTREYRLDRFKQDPLSNII